MVIMFVMLVQIDDYYETMAVSRDRHKLERIRFRMRHAHDFATQLLAADVSPISQLINRKEAKQNLTESLQYELPDVTVHHSKLDRYVNFLPGRAHVELGTLLKCSNTKQGRKVIDLPQRMPSSKAMFLHKLRPDDDDYTMGDVISLAFLPNNDVVVLTSDGKKVTFFNHIMCTVSDTRLQNPFHQLKIIKVSKKCFHKKIFAVITLISGLPRACKSQV